MTTIKAMLEPLLCLWVLLTIFTLGPSHAKELRQSGDKTFDVGRSAEQMLSEFASDTATIGVPASNLAPDLKASEVYWTGAKIEQLPKLQQLGDSATRQKTKSGLIIESNAHGFEFTVDSDNETQEKHESSTVAARKRNKSPQQQRKRNGRNGQRRKIHKDGKYWASRQKEKRKKEKNSSASKSGKFIKRFSGCLLLSSFPLSISK